MKPSNIGIQDVLKSDLLKEIIQIKIDSMWKMFALMDSGHFPEPDEEGATGVFDNKGAIFIPGGLVYEDSDGRPLGRKEGTFRDYDNFSETIRFAMKHDNATILYPEFAQIGITLPNEFLTKTAVKILNMRNVLRRSRAGKTSNYIPKVDSGIIARAYSPHYIYPPYGTRMKVSSCLAVCKSEINAYFLESISHYSLRGIIEERFWEALCFGSNPILNAHGGVMIPSEIVVCHTSRYNENSIVGLTRILGLGKLGRSAVLSIEFYDAKLHRELEKFDGEFKSGHTIAEYKKKKAVLVIRIYSTRGSINTKTHAKLRNISLLNPNDLEMNLEHIKSEAYKKYY